MLAGYAIRGRNRKGQAGKRSAERRTDEERERVDAQRRADPVDAARTHRHPGKAPHLPA